MSGLSSLQQSILKWLLYQVRSVEQADPKWLKYGIEWRPPWMPQLQDKAQDKALENVFRASLCRSLARLENRGLITRMRGRKNARTVNVMLTAEGRKVAEALSGN